MNLLTIAVCLSLTLVIAECMLRLKVIALEHIEQRESERRRAYRIKAYEESAKHRSSVDERARALAISYSLRGETR